MSEEKKCVKCGGLMIEGSAMEFPINRVPVNYWVEGKTKKSWWTKFKLINVNFHPITAYRCTKCGYLEMYVNLNEQGENK